MTGGAVVDAKNEAQVVRHADVGGFKGFFFGSKKTLASARWIKMVFF